LRAPRRELPCRRCGLAAAVGFESVLDEIDLAALGAERRRLSLRAAGLRPGDVISLGGSSGSRYFEIAANTQEGRRNGSRT
jgi:hypothetical protein